VDLWSLHIPIPVALAAVATIGYLVGRRRSPQEVGNPVQSRRELRRAESVARELEKIAWVVRRQLSKHHASLHKFKQRVSQLGAEEHEAAWKELCREAEEILRPTLALSNQIAAAYDELRQQTNNLMSFTEVRTDPLTGVSNRRALDDTLTSQFALRERYHSEFSIAIFDIDHFKQVNDLHGHLQGDRILQQVAGLLDQSVRETDIVVRYGGEEFVVVMPQTGLEGAGIFAERMRQRIDRELPVTVSGGLAAASEGDAPETLLKRADSALYAAKSAGRNCCFHHNGEAVESLADNPVPTRV
jgi:diguanylate cyclase (GGDEF)-like protein